MYSCLADKGVILTQLIHLSIEDINVLLRSLEERGVDEYKFDEGMYTLRLNK